MERRDSGENQLVIDEGASERNSATTSSTTDSVAFDLYNEETLLDFIEESAPKTSVQKGKINSKQKKVALTALSKAPKPFKPIQTFKLSTMKSLKATSLNISAKRSDFYNMKLYLMPGNVLAAEVKSHYPPEPSMSDISLKQLLNWPGMAVTLTLRDVTYTRKLMPNFNRAVVFGNDQYVNLDQSENVTDTRRLSQTSSNKCGLLISKEIFETYSAAVGDALDVVDVSKTRIQEIQMIIEAMKDDLATLENLYLKTTFSRFPNSTKYMRAIDHKIDAAQKPHQTPDVYVREVINPEFEFTIERCTFTSESLASWKNVLCDYFDLLFVQRDHITLEAFREMIKKCISFECIICNEQFDGVLCIHAARAHLGKHFCDRKWSCINCQLSFSQADLVDMGWKHVCSDSGEAN